jgi:hypothetical protein
VNVGIGKDDTLVRQGQRPVKFEIKGPSAAELSASFRADPHMQAAKTPPCTAFLFITGNLAHEC